jgi:hypothetical protein
LALALLAGACGCARTTVQGTVTYRGRPVTHGSVIFLSADRTVRSGVIGPTGTYTVTGVHPGPVKIGVISRYAPRAGADRARDRVRPGKQPLAAKAASQAFFALPRKYENPEASGLSCTLVAGRASHDIDLK